MARRSYMKKESRSPSLAAHPPPIKTEDLDTKMEGSSTVPSTPTTAKTEGKPLTPKIDPDSRPSATPPVSSSSHTRSRAQSVGPQLVGHLPVSAEEALQTFEEIPENRYQYGTLGRSREALESMSCDCQYEHGVDDPTDACGDGSDCINRLTQVECLPDDCRCHAYCQNQRFQRKEYAPIEIVQTEKKGYGLRASADIPRDGFIYEYVGDVVSHPSFMKRMREYAADGIRHFYFMMLQKEEYIDATKRGGIGRFANHSCNPNCYVAKWTVGQRVRMGIFAKRLIRKDEEITFNYNVDRYGHDAQPCYCGEPNCVGFLGGKTQTDIAAMDDLYLDALGISDEVEKLGLKGSKKRKGKKLDEDYMPELKPLVEKDVPKVIQAMRQTQSRKVLFKLLTRIKMTEDQPALRQLMRLRGFSLMTNILEDYANDEDIMRAAMQCMATWPLIQRNKVEDSKVDVPVRQCAQNSESEELKGLAQKLLDQWDALEIGYRIPRRVRVPGEEYEEPLPPPKRSPSPPPVVEKEERPRKRLRYTSRSIFDWARSRSSHLTVPSTPPPRKPITDSAPPTPDPRPSKPLSDADTPLPHRLLEPRPDPVKQHRDAVAAVIAAANAEAAQAAAQASTPTRSGGPDEGDRSKSDSSRKLTREEREANKEKRLQKLVGAVVVKCMSKYSKEIPKDLFKKHAKELTQLIAEKEKKSSSYKDDRLESLSDEKTAKIKKYAKDYIAKLLRKMDKSGQRYKPSSKEGGASPHAANGDVEAEGEPADDGMAMTVEEAMDMDEDADPVHQNGDMHGDQSASPTPTVHLHGEDQGRRGSDASPATDSTTTTLVDAADPRSRHQSSEWDADRPQKMHVDSDSQRPPLVEAIVPDASS